MSSGWWLCMKREINPGLSALLGVSDLAQMMRFAENLTCISVANKAQVDG